MIDIKNIKKLAKELRQRGIKYETIGNSKLKKHWDSIEIVTNDDMRIMCSNFFKREYDLLTSGEQTKVRKEVFRQLRGDSDG